MLSKDQAIEKYGAIPLKFSSYYKYTFTYLGVGPDGEHICGSYGGDSGEIYKHSVEPESTITLDFCYSARITIGDETIADWYDC